MHGQLHVKEGCLWLDLMWSPDVSMHVSVTGVFVIVEHGQDVLTNVAFAPSLSFLCIFCVLVLALISPSFALSGVCVCAYVSQCLYISLKVLFVCFQSCDCDLGLTPSSIHVSIMSQKHLPVFTSCLTLNRNSQCKLDDCLLKSRLHKQIEPLDQVPHDILSLSYLWLCFCLSVSRFITPGGGQGDPFSVKEAR